MSSAPKSETLRYWFVCQKTNCAGYPRAYDTKSVASNQVENFCGHSKNDYYNNTIIHRGIKSFMVQMGDPLGDGTVETPPQFSLGNPLSGLVETPSASIFVLHATLNEVTCGKCGVFDCREVLLFGARNLRTSSTVT